MAAIQYTLLAFAGLILSGSVLPLVRLDYWTFRVFDFPRIQKLVLSFCVLVLMLVFPSPQAAYYVVSFLLAVNCLYLISLIYPYTPLAKRWVKSVAKVREENCISLVVANVLQDNDDYAGCLGMLEKADPDLVLLLETNASWQQGVSRLRRSYPVQIEVPLENTYGMLLFSKLPIRDKKVAFLVENDIPSIHCQLQLRSGQWIQLYCVHPTPPVPNENPRSTERDKELLLIADKAMKQQLPVLVFGDLNDVAWSYTTGLFLKMSGLLDPRRGRGFFNTFNAKSRLMRFPLDHVFVSPHFKLVNMRRLYNFNSDHFPIYGKYQFEAGASAEQQPEVPDEEDVQVAEEKKQAV